jgi:ribonuclease T2
MLVQFWDTDPPTGPSDRWTIHGLWPDNCDGTFESNCDPERFYDDLTGLLTDQGATDTLAFMEKYWVDLHGDNEKFWSHEWNKHGTCFSTLEPRCLPGRPKGAEAVAFFKTVVALFKTRPTYQLLAAEGIVPSSSRTYTRNQIVSALRKGGGPTPVLDCKRGVLNQISYYYNVKGSVIDGKFIPTEPTTSGKCPSRIKYLPKESED